MPLQPNNTKSAGFSRTLAGLIILGLWFAGLASVAANRQSILDWWKLKSYQVPSTISALADQDTMTDYARKVFYVNQPKIDSKADFASHCLNGGAKEQTIVLGCYHSTQNGIFLLAVSDSRLDGVQQVTAAHEMLHGAYDRLSTEERQKVGKMLKDYYGRGLTDTRVLQTIAAYKKSEPNDLTNEMHSIFGTEVANLPSDLETYYKRYFNDRSKIASYAAQYQAVFTSRQTRLKQYEDQLSSLKNQISAKEADLKNQQQVIADRQAQLNSQRGSGNVSAYNAGVAQYNATVDAYNTEIEEVKGLINEYNEIVAAHNALAEEQGQLINELDAQAPSPIQ